MPFVLTKNFESLELELSPFNQLPVVTADIQQTLSRTLGWDESSRLWRRLLLDSDGAIILSSQPSKATTGDNSAVSVLIASTTILNANGSRKGFVLRNNGATNVYVSYETPAVAAIAFPILPGETYSDDAYTGALYGISDAAPNDVRVVELT